MLKTPPLHTHTHNPPVPPTHTPPHLSTCHHTTPHTHLKHLPINARVYTRTQHTHTYGHTNARTHTFHTQTHTHTHTHTYTHIHTTQRHFGAHEPLLKEMGARETATDVDLAGFLHELANECGGLALNPNELAAVVKAHLLKRQLPLLLLLLLLLLLHCYYYDYYYSNNNRSMYDMYAYASCACTRKSTDV